MESRLLLAVALVAVSLAGCTDDAGDTTDGAIKINTIPEDPSTEAVVLDATVTADSYSWNMGDGRGKVEGKTVEHVYGVTDGTFKVELTTTTGGESKTWAPLQLVLGTGQNQAPSYKLQMDWNWVQVGEDMTLSAAASTDPEGDPILLQWFCQKKSDIALAGGGHAHGGAGGVQFGTGSAAVIPVEVLNGTGVPAADKSISGDFCSGMATTTYEEGTGISGAFTERGIYEVTMLAKDPGHPGVPATTTIYVTDEPRANGTVSHSFTGTIERGAPQSAYGPLATAGDRTHIHDHDFKIQYPILSVQASLSHEGGAGTDIQYEIRKGDSSKHGPTTEALDKGEGFLSPGDYTAWVYLRAGVNVAYDVTVTYEYITDPAKLFEAPGGH